MATIEGDLEISGTNHEAIDSGLLDGRSQIQQAVSLCRGEGTKGVYLDEEEPETLLRESRRKT
jgi:hypothetical protein